MISEAKVTEIGSRVWTRTSEKMELIGALREAAEIIEHIWKRHHINCVCPTCGWMREWRGESEKQGEA